MERTLWDAIIALASGHSLADYSSNLVVRLRGRSISLTARGFTTEGLLCLIMEQREIAETPFPSQTREEIRDAIKLEEERRAALVKNLYRLRALRNSRDRRSIRKQHA
jgi:hypothetical protein